MADFILTAQLREDKGKGASRRLRREGWVPGVLYGGDREPRSISLKSNELAQALMQDAFYSNVLTIKVGDVTQDCILKDLQRHPAREEAMHIDLMRVVAGQEFKTTVPLHFVGEDLAPGIKLQGGALSKSVVDVEIICMPKDLPEFIEVDVSALNKDETVHLSDIKLPEGVKLVELMHGEGSNDLAIASIRATRVSKDLDAEDAPGAEAAEGETEVAGDDA